MLEGDKDGDAPGESEAVALPVPLSVGVGEGVPVEEALTVEGSLTVGEGVCEGVPGGVPLGDAPAERVGLAAFSSKRTLRGGGSFAAEGTGA